MAETEDLKSSKYEFESHFYHQPFSSDYGDILLIGVGYAKDRRQKVDSSNDLPLLNEVKRKLPILHLSDESHDGVLQAPSIYPGLV